MMLVIALSALVAPQDALPTVDDIRRGLLLRDATFRHAAFQLTFHEKHRISRAAPLVQRVQTISGVVDSADQARIEVVSKETVPGGHQEGIIRRYTETSNPAGSRYYTAGGGEEPPNGWIKGAKGLSWAASPLDLLGIARHSPISYLSAVPDIAIGGSESVNGRMTVKLTWNHRDEQSGAGRRGTFWISPSLGYAVVKTAEESKIGEGKPWKLVRQRDFFKFREVGGIWFPGKVVLAEHSYYLKDGAYEVRQQLVGEFSDWKVDSPVDEATFTIDFPKGTHVQDYVAGGRGYQVGEINDTQVKAHAEQAAKLVQDSRAGLEGRFNEAITQDPFRTEGIPRWVVVAGVGSLVLVASALVVAYVRARRKPG